MKHGNQSHPAKRSLFGVTERQCTFHLSAVDGVHGVGNERVGFWRENDSKSDDRHQCGRNSGRTKYHIIQQHQYDDHGQPRNHSAIDGNQPADPPTLHPFERNHAKCRQQSQNAGKQRNQDGGSHAGENQFIPSVINVSRSLSVKPPKRLYPSPEAFLARTISTNAVSW